MSSHRPRIVWDKQNCQCVLFTAHRCQKKRTNDTNPKMTAFQTMMLFSDGAPLTPAGGSSWRLKNKLPGEVTLHILHLHYDNTKYCTGSIQIHYRRGIMTFTNGYCGEKSPCSSPREQPVFKKLPRAFSIFCVAYRLKSLIRRRLAGVDMV